MYDYYLFPLPHASKWNCLIFDHSEVKIDLYLLLVEMLFTFEPHHKKNQLFAYAETKTQISFAVTTKLISTFVFATPVV